MGSGVELEYGETLAGELDGAFLAVKELGCVGGVEKLVGGNAVLMGDAVPESGIGFLEIGSSPN